MRPRLTYANVVATLALVIAVSGGAAFAANTVFSSDIVDGQVKTPDLANGAVANAKLAGGAVTSEKVVDNDLKGRDVLDNTLKGVDIDEGSLAGGLIPGIATSGLVKSSGLVAVDDPADFSETVKVLLTAGPFTVTGACNDLGKSGRSARVQIFSSAGNWSFDSDADGGSDERTELPAGAAQFMGFLADPGFGVSGPALDVGAYAAAAPTKLLAGEVLAGANLMGTDCVFGVTGIG